MRRRTAYPAAAVLAIALVAVLATPASAVPAGSLDPSFGVGGVTIADFGDGVQTCTFDGKIPSCHGGEEGATDVAPMPDGSVVVMNGLGGGGVLTRLRPDGRVDPTFGNNGATVLPGGGSGPVGVDDEGRLYVSWTPNPNVAPGSLAITRLRPNGTLDFTYGLGGTVVHENFKRWAVAPNGQVFLYWGGIEDNGDRALHVSRLSITGAADASYAASGEGTLLMPPQTPDGWVVEPDPVVDLAPTGEVVVLNRAYTFVGPFSLSRVVIGRLDPWGEPDLTFSPTGGVRFPTGPAWFPSMFEVNAKQLEVLPDGRMLVGGIRPVPDGSAVSVIRLDAAGDLDPTFAFGGIQIVDLTTAPPASGQSSEQLDWVGSDAFGRTIVVGASGTTDATHALRRSVVRLGADGFVDASFGLGGVTTLPTELEGGGSAFGAFPDGSVVVGGTARAENRLCGPATALVRCADLLVMKLRG